MNSIGSARADYSAHCNLSPASTPDRMLFIELSLRRPDPSRGCGVGFPAVWFCDVVTSERRLRCDPTSPTHAGGSPDPPLFADHHSPLPALGRRVCQTLPQAARPARAGAHSPIPVISDQGKTGVPVHLCSAGLRAALSLYPHTPSQNRDRAHPIPAARTNACR